jgi:choline dehydrogenase
MFNTETASTGVKFALLQGQLLTNQIDRGAFVARAANLGLPASVVGEAADKFLGIAANQATRRSTLRSRFDYIVVGSGASGSVVGRRARGDGRRARRASSVVAGAEVSTNTILQ